MPKRDAFSDYHPAVGFLFFALVGLFTMCWLHPADLLITLTGALLWHSRLRGGKAVCRSMLVLLPLMLLTAVLNGLFSRVGTTVLLTLPSGRPLMLEALLYGAAAGVMLGAVLQWFACYHRVMTSDKFLYLFGRIVPALSLIVCMTLRFVPVLRTRTRAAVEAQRCLGRDFRQGGWSERLRGAVAVLSILITWTMESAMETADSMKGRGYGLPGRASFSVYRFESRDRWMLLWLLFCGGALCAAWLSGAMAWQYYPTLHCGAVTPLTVLFHLVYLALCLTPWAADVWEKMEWKRERGEAERI